MSRGSAGPGALRRILAALALGACLALLLGGEAGAAKEKVPSTLKVKYKGADPSDPYGTYEISGKVGPKKCAAGRKVTVKGFGAARTESSGRFVIPLTAAAQPGTYKAKVAPKKKRGLTCKRARATLKIK
jgi:hypothetical protein